MTTVKRDGPLLLCAVMMIGSTLACESKERPGQLGPTSVAPEPESEPTEGTSPSSRVPARAEPAVARAATVWSFDETAPGSMPDGWSTPVGEWRVEAVPEAP